MKQFKINDELISKIKKLIEDNNTHKLLSSLADIHYADLAEIFELLETTEVIFLVKIFFEFCFPSPLKSFFVKCGNLFIISWIS